MTTLSILNQQSPEKRNARDDGALDVHSIFPTIQGEGPFAGTPCVFVRLAACNLQCPSCDTEYLIGRQLVSVTDLVRKVRWLRSYGLVVITGGEPFRQACGRAVMALVNAGYQVQFETNGTIYDPTMELVWREPVDDHQVTIVCSPKTGDISDQLKPHVTALKYILSAGEVDADGLPTSSLNFGVQPCRPWKEFTGQVFLQACDSRDESINRANQQAAIASCLKFGYRFCYQIHKAVDLP